MLITFLVGLFCYFAGALTATRKWQKKFVSMRTSLDEKISSVENLKAALDEHLATFQVLEKNLQEAVEHASQGRQIERGLVEGAIRRETCAKAALNAVITATGGTPEDVERVMHALDE